MPQTASDTRTVSIIFRFTNRDCWGDIRGETGEVRPEPGEENFTNVLWIRNVPWRFRSEQMVSLLPMIDHFKYEGAGVSLGEFEWQDFIDVIIRSLTGEKCWAVLPVTVLERDSSARSNVEMILEKILERGKDAEQENQKAEEGSSSNGESVKAVGQEVS